MVSEMKDSPEYQGEVGFIDLEKPAASGFLISPKSSQPANLKDTHTHDKTHEIWKKTAAATELKLPAKLIWRQRERKEVIILKDFML